MVLKKIVSGGQTGADRAGLDVAIDNDIPHGGWIPKGRRTEEGPLDPKYNLQQTNSRDWKPRTERNLRLSDGTIILTYGPIQKRGGTALTVRLCEQFKKPCLYVDMNTDEVVEEDITKWLQDNNIEVLNVAGPRASKEPNVYHDAYDMLETVVKTLKK